ncbi:hypothetical protein [Corynebacterium pseudotuberculosis]|nr:hypothetical protein [Corynebacterium pseudotuberculosis]
MGSVVLGDDDGGTDVVVVVGAREGSPDPLVLPGNKYSLLLLELPVLQAA